MPVAVIGAGAAGLVTAVELEAEGLKPVVFEANASPGGIWIYNPRVPDDPLGRAPAPSVTHGALYASLRTNLPRDLMALRRFPFTTDLGGDPRRFPGHAEVLRYLRAYSRTFGLDRYVRTDARVTQVQPRADDDTPWTAAHPRPPARWRVHWLRGGREHHENFDAVAVCNGHYHQPRIPALPGLDAFAGRVLHSFAYREPRGFEGATVALLGAKSSGVDLSRELATVARRVLLCARDLPRADGLGPQRNLDHRPPIVRVEPRALCLSDGTREPNVDALVLCTGYRYTFPFLPARARLLDPVHDRVFPLYLDLVAARARTLAFIGLPFSVVPFPLFEHQARLWARVLSGRVALPDAPARLAHARHREARMSAAGVAPRHRLRYAGEHQFRYGAGLAALAGDVPPPAWRAPLYAAVGQARQRDPWGYRDAVLPTGEQLMNG
ncbi:MAG: NAD(P)-binding protein [Myxococcota bacterium]